VERTHAFTLYAERARRWCEIRWMYQQGLAEPDTREDQLLVLQLGTSLVAVNVWLTRLGADSGYAFGTVYEYGKVLLYTLTWLAQEPVRLGTAQAVDRSLFALERADMRALFAWLDLPASAVQARLTVCQTGQLPVGYQELHLSAATRNVRVSALSTFYDWLIAEYLPEMKGREASAFHPLERFEHPLSSWQERQRPEGLLPRSISQIQRPSKLLRRRTEAPCPQALSPEELHLVFEALPLVSHGRNAANRNGALLRVMLWGMLRISELVGTTWEAVDGEALQIMGKGRKARLVPIVDQGTWTYLNAYTNELRLPLEQRFRGALFRQIDHEEVALTKHSVEHLLLALKAHFQQRVPAVSIGQQRVMTSLCEKLHSHIFRATGATLFAAAGMDLIRLSLLLGHENPATTQRYYVAAEQMKLSGEVQQICLRVQQTLEQPMKTPVVKTASPLGWYERRGYLPVKQGGFHDDGAGEH
jgi:site-specific recombinase XerD